MKNNTEERGVIAEYWAWVAVPFVLVVGGLAAVVWMTGTGFAGEEDDGSAFVYNVF